jgi:hypothetical protein
LNPQPKKRNVDAEIIGSERLKVFKKLFGWLGKNKNIAQQPPMSQKSQVSQAPRPENAKTVTFDEAETLEFLSNFVKPASVKKAISGDYAIHLKSKYGAEVQNVLDAVLGSELLVDASIEESIAGNFSLAELKALAKENGQKTGGKKIELAGRIAPLDLNLVKSRVANSRTFSCADSVREKVEKHIKQKRRRERDTQWGEYNRLSGVYAQTGDWDKYAFNQKSMAEQLLEEDKNEQALMHASVALYIAANGPNNLSADFIELVNLCEEVSGQLDSPKEVTWAPGVNSRVMPYHLRPFLEASRRLNLQGDELRQAYLDACQRLFKHTFGAPLSYAEAWEAIIISEAWNS